MADNRMLWTMSQKATSGQRETARIERRIKQWEYIIASCRLNIVQFAAYPECVATNQAELVKAEAKLAKLQAQYEAL